MNGQLILARRIRLAKRPTAPREARKLVQETVTDWPISVDTSVAVLLTSELVTNALAHEPGPHITLVIRGLNVGLRVEVHDTSAAMPALIPMKNPAEPETGRGLILVDTLADHWGFYRTPAGKAVHFTLRYIQRKPRPAVSFAHVSATLARAGHQRADPPRIGEHSGFVVAIRTGTVTVRYRDYDYQHRHDDDAQTELAVITEAAFEGYAATLRAAGYHVKDWTRGGVRLGLLVTGKT